MCAIFGVVVVVVLTRVFTVHMHEYKEYKFVHMHAEQEYTHQKTQCEFMQGGWCFVGGWMGEWLEGCKYT